MAEATAVVEEETVDATVVEEPYQAPQPTTQLVRRERRSEVLRPLDTDALVESFHEYQEMLPKLLVESDYQQAGDKRFVKKSGWRKIATAFDLDVLLVGDEVERDEQGRVVRAKVVARAIAPSGRTMDGDGYCSVDESRFQSSRADLSKLENDLRGTATTRAKNRAIADLVGMGDVSAEEVNSNGQPEGPPYGMTVDAEVKQNAIDAAVKIAGGDRDGARVMWEKVQQHCGGYFPQAAAFVFLIVADSLSGKHLAGTQDQAAEQPDQPEPVAPNRTEPPSEAEIAGLEDALAEAWKRAGVSELEAKKKVLDCRGRPNALQVSLQAAQRTLTQKERVSK